MTGGTNSLGRRLNWVSLSGVVLSVCLVGPASATDYIRPRRACPQALTDLMPLLLRDLPSYANRVNQRAYDDFRTAETPGYVLLASLPDYQPLTLGPGSYTSSTELGEPAVPQVFFTTLERQYFSGRAVELQNHHWLFMVETDRGWQLALMYSAVGEWNRNTEAGSQSAAPPTPPQDSSDGVIGQAIRLWLRDCQAGRISELL